MSDGGRPRTRGGSGGASAPDAHAPPMWTGRFAQLLIGNLAVLGSLMMVMTILPVYLQDLGIDAAGIGWIIAIFNFAATGVRLVVGREMDRRGRRAILVVGLVAFGLGNLAYVIAQGGADVSLIRVFHGIAWGVVNTAITVVVIDILPLARRGEGVSVYAISAGLPTAVMPWFALMLVEQLSFSVAFGIAAVLPLAALVLMIRAAGRIELPQEGPKPALLDAWTLVPGAVALLIGATHGAVTALIPLYLLDLGSIGTGLFFFLFTVAVTAARLFLRRVYDRYGARPLMLTSLPAASLGLIVLGSDASTVPIVVSAFVYGAGLGVSKPTVQVWCVDRVPATRRGSANATFYTGFDLGLALGSLVFGAVAGWLGFGPMFMVASIAPALGLALFLAAAPPHHLRESAA